MSGVRVPLPAQAPVRPELFLFQPPYTTNNPVMFGYPSRLVLVQSTRIGSHDDVIRIFMTAANTVPESTRNSKINHLEKTDPQ